MGHADTPLTVSLGFMPEAAAIPDVDHPGLLRAGPRGSAPYGGESVEMHLCEATDWAQDDAVEPNLFDFGFDMVDLTSLRPLQERLARVREAGAVTDDDAELIRSALRGATLPLSAGSSVEVLHIADEGFIMRKGGPNRLSVVGPRSRGMNDHGAATSVHVDQDVFGTPLTQVMGGRAPELFRHDSPDGQNREAGLMLVNMWIPLQQITQPLVLADARSLDRRRHQLRYGLATTSFLERDEDMEVNDIWTFLHDDGQRWYFRSEMDHRNAYVFDTLSTPHSACTLPGEEEAERSYLALQDAEAAVRAGDAAALTEALAPVSSVPVPESTPPALRRALATMAALVRGALDDPAAVCGSDAEQWCDASAAARRSVVRMSLEMRVVVSVDPVRQRG